MGVARVLVIGHEYPLPGVLIDIQLIERHLARDSEDQVGENVERDLRPAASWRGSPASCRGSPARHHERDTLSP